MRRIKHLIGNSLRLLKTFILCLLLIAIGGFVFPAVGQDQDSGAKFHEEGVAYQKENKLEEAVKSFTKALKLREEELGEEHLKMGETAVWLGSIYKTQGKYEEAEPLYKRALAICEKQLGADHPDTATSLSNLALLY
ncbi:MAG: tetratricopeptide repeat protein, partial [Verrucomicrobiota bacterium]